MESRRQRSIYEIERERQMEVALEEERKQLLLALALEQRDNLTSSAKSALLRQHGQSMDIAIKNEFKEFENTYEEILSQAAVNSMQEAHEMVSAHFQDGVRDLHAAAASTNNFGSLANDTNEKMRRQLLSSRLQQPQSVTPSCINPTIHASTSVQGQGHNSKQLVSLQVHADLQEQLNQQHKISIESGQQDIAISDVEHKANISHNSKSSSYHHLSTSATDSQSSSKAISPAKNVIFSSKENAASSFSRSASTLDQTIVSEDHIDPQLPSTISRIGSNDSVRSQSSSIASTITNTTNKKSNSSLVPSLEVNDIKTAPPSKVIPLNERSMGNLPLQCTASKPLESFSRSNSMDRSQGKSDLQVLTGVDDNSRNINSLKSTELKKDQIDFDVNSDVSNNNTFDTNLSVSVVDEKTTNSYNDVEVLSKSKVLYIIYFLYYLLIFISSTY